MSALDLLKAVLPSDGFYCAAGFTVLRKQHKYVASPEDCAATAHAFAAARKDAYFALASFRESGSRKAHNALYMRSLFIDVDCGEGKAYEKKRDGALALQKFLADSGLQSLGQPWVVDSGGGLHVYWPLDADAEIADWLPVAEALKRAAHQHGFKIDMSRTADAASVLRVPDTYNYKAVYGTPRAVVLKVKGDVFNLEALRKVLPPALVRIAQSAPIDIPGQRPAQNKPSALAQALLSNTEVRFRDILKRTVDGTGCLQLAHYVRNAKHDGMEPLWRGMLSLTKVCSDGAGAAEKISAMHPYPRDRMELKLREIKGPYPCTKFDSENPGVCDKCPHFGKITNPLALGRSLQEDVDEKTYLDTTAQESEPQRTLTRPPPPKGFVYGQHGGVFMVREEEVGGTMVKQNVMLLPYDFFVVDVLHENGEHVAHMVAMRQSGPHDVLLKMRAIVSRDEAAKALAEQNIVASYGSGNDKNLVEYVRAAITEASLQRSATSIPTQYGWQSDGSFVLHGVIYFADGTLRKTPTPSLENLHMATKPSGSLEGWRNIMRLMMQKNLFEHLSIASIGFGAPLMQFTGLAGLTFHAGHKESGTGKSLALSLAASIWGNPTNYRVGKQTSPVAMQQRAGSLNSLPFLCDELTMKARGDMEWFPAFVFDFSEGRGKERMEAGTNRERVNTTTWSSLAYFTSNIYMLDYMTGVRQHSSEGEIRRFLDWEPSGQLYWEPHEIDVVRSINTHYGHAGVIYAKWLAQNRDVAANMVRKVQARLYEEYDATNDERYWIAGVASVLAGATLAGTKYAGIIDLPVRQMVDVFREMINRGRSALKSGQKQAEDVLNEYTREFFGQFIVVRKVSGGLLAELGNGGIVDNSITRTKIAGRVEHGFSGAFVDYYIEEALLRRHCTSIGFGYKEFIDAIQKRFSCSFVRKDLAHGTKAPPMRVYALKISRRSDDPVPLAPGQ